MNSVLWWIIISSLLGGFGGVLAASAVGSFLETPRRISLLVSYAIGALLGASFLEVIPHAFSDAQDMEKVSATILMGILGFFVLEKLVLWRHCHHDACEAHEVIPASHDHGRSGMMVLIGHAFHCFVDGVLIAAAFMRDTQLGFVTALAIIAHEIPQELGDYMVLRHSGYSRKKAVLFNLFSSLTMLLGGLLAYVALSSLTAWIPYILAVSAASMIYVAIADLIPGLHKRAELTATLQQVLLIALGVATIFTARAFFDHGHDHEHEQQMEHDELVLDRGLFVQENSL